jgi:hypothetical protein
MGNMTCQLLHIIVSCVLFANPDAFDDHYNDPHQSEQRNQVNNAVHSLSV